MFALHRSQLGRECVLRSSAPGAHIYRSTQQVLLPCKPFLFSCILCRKIGHLWTLHSKQLTQSSSHGSPVIPEMFARPKAHRLLMPLAAIEDNITLVRETQGKPDGFPSIRDTP